MTGERFREFEVSSRHRIQYEFIREREDLQIGQDIFAIQQACTEIVDERSRRAHGQIQLAETKTL